MISFNKNSDIIQIVAPASRPHGDCVKLLEQGLEMLQDYGFNAYASKRIISKEPYMFYANTLEERVRDFQDALINEQVRIIWCLRGGYGSCEVANMLLDFKIGAPKILIGFSDITSMHILFNQHLKLPSLHANNIASCIRYPDSLQKVLSTLSGVGTVLDLISLNTPSFNNFVIEGEIAGGNLKVLTTLIGTALAPNFDNKILILEDINEPSYAIMRDLMHLRYAGLLADIKAIIFGDFIQADGYLDQTLKEFSQNLEIPAFMTSGFGHGSINYPVVLGGKGKIINNILSADFPYLIS